MKKYKAPKTTLITIDEELLLGNSYNPNDVTYSRKNNIIVTDDEYLGSDISYNKGVFRSAEENSDDATIVNHY